MSEKNLLSEITHCPHARKCLEDPSTENPCRDIVNSQKSLDLDNFQIPEPWSGQIEQAPILFLSSNPSIGSDEVYPTWRWSDNDINNYFNYRFGGGQKDWIINGKQSLMKDGTYSRAVKFWAAVRQRAIELLQRDVNPGIDYALTEIVHCKSHSEIGVEQAQDQCVKAYLLRTLELSRAKVIVVLGAPARQAIQSQFNISSTASISESIKIGDYERFFAFLPHPNARMPRSFIKCLQDDELESLRASLR
ncbi:uracil-DNA glycosylase family protein [Microcoleus sp. B4-D4]|uniref:uracil-DNA glycosylase family protein n=1 Tax=Microcoleus sp. B4-D4 TaxID=2818667 RepID=UPI002FD0BBD0